MNRTSPHVEGGMREEAASPAACLASRRAMLKRDATRPMDICEDCGSWFVDEHSCHLEEATRG